MPLDPGLLRFTAALRTTLATVICSLLIVPFLSRTGQPIIECAPIILFVMLALLFSRDQTLVQRQTTVALAFLSGSAAFATASWLEHWTFIGPAGILVLLGAATLLQTRGSRIVAVGLGSIVGYYIGLFLHPSLSGQLTIYALMLPAVVICLVLLRLLPDDPATVGHLMLASIAAQADRVVTEARHPQRDPQRLERHLMQLNRAVIVAQGQLTLSELPGYEATLDALINLEVAVTHAVLRTDEAGAGETLEWRKTLAELTRAAAEMGRNGPPAESVSIAATALPTPPLAWRPALRAMCAGVIAACIGYPLSPEHWYWAIISVFVISTGTNSAGDTIQKGLLRVAGTVGGALAGICVAAFVPAHPAVVVAGMAVCVFGWSYFVLHNYAVGIFFLTLLIGLVYGVLGQDLPEIVGLRVLETAIGATAAFVTAMWLVPLPTSQHVRTRALALIARLLDVIDVSRDALAAKTGGASPLAAMRRADHAMQDLRTALLPLRAGRLIALIPRADALPRVLICVHWVRVLAVAAASQPTLLPEDRDALLNRLGRLREHLATIGVTAESGAEHIATVPAFPTGSASASLIAEAADRIEGAIFSLFGGTGATPREFAAALLA